MEWTAEDVAHLVEMVGESNTTSEDIPEDTKRQLENRTRHVLGALKIAKIAAGIIRRFEGAQQFDEEAKRRATELLKSPLLQVFSSDRWEKEAEKRARKCEQESTKRIKTKDYTCGACGSNNCGYTLVQLRSLDEPMTKFMECIACGRTGRPDTRDFLSAGVR